MAHILDQGFCIVMRALGIRCFPLQSVGRSALFSLFLFLQVRLDMSVVLSFFLTPKFWHRHASFYFRSLLDCLELLRLGLTLRRV
jgi:hypothetical protein